MKPFSTILFISKKSEASMDELRRKIVLTAPLYSAAGLLTACGGGNETSIASSTGRADAMAINSAPVYSTLKLTDASGGNTIDSWQSLTGSYLVPNTAESIKGVINNKVFHLSVVEQTVIGSVTVTRALLLSLTNGNIPTHGSSFALNGSSFLIDGAAVSSTGVMTALTDGSSLVPEFCSYTMSNTAGQSGTISVTSTATNVYKLSFANVNFTANSGTGASKDFQLNGYVYILAASESANWL